VRHPNCFGMEKDSPSPARNAWYSKRFLQTITCTTELINRELF